MKQTLIFGLVLLLATAVWGAKTKKVELPDIMKPGSMTVDDSQLYIVDGTSIYIYSLKDYKLVTKFGKAGEGPKEFKTNPFGPPISVFPYPGHLLVNSTGKISFFTRDGKFKSERRAPQFNIISEIKDHFVGIGFKQVEQQSYLCVNLYDSEPKKTRELYVSDITVGPNAKFNLPGSTLDYAAYKDKIYVPTGRMDCVIDVFDIEGKRLHRIQKEIEKVPVTSDYKKKSIKWFKNDSPFKQFFQYFKDKIKFKSHFPALKQFFVNSGKIYAITHNKNEDGKNQVIVMDLKGKELKRVFLSMTEGTPIMTSLLYMIYNDHFYQIIENEDEEQWELHIEPI